MDDIALSAGVRANLLNLNKTEKLMTRTNLRLSTGKDVNQAIDNPVNYFGAQNLTDRAEGLNARLDGIGQAIQTIKAAENGVNAIRDILANMQATIQQAADETDPEMRRDLGRQYNELLEQAQEIAKDSSYAGVNLLQGNEELSIQFNERFDQSELNIDGFNIQGPGIQSDGTTRTRNAIGEIPASPVTGMITLGPTPSQPSFASQSATVSRASQPSYPSTATQGSRAFISSQVSQGSQVFQASQASVAANGTFPSQPSIASQGAVASQAELPSRPSLASIGSVASRGSVSDVVSQPSVASQASIGATGTFTRTQEYAFTINNAKKEIGTHEVVGLKSFGLDATAPGGHEVDWGSGNFKELLKEKAIAIEDFDSQLKVQLSNLASNMSVLTIREEFTEELMSTLNEGADKLVLADMDAEGANLLALQTRQQLGIQSLALATQQSQAVLRLLG